MDNENNNEMSFHDMIMSIKKIDAIVVVDDVRTLTEEDMERIRKQVAEDKKNSGKDSEDNSEE
jgi:hypothetical protein